MRQGAVRYLIKPFTFAMPRAKLEHYATYRAAAAGRRDVTDQSEIDAALGSLRDPGDAGLVGASRVTMRRYPDNLAVTGACEREPGYGSTGRPKLLYRLRPST